MFKKIRTTARIINAQRKMQKKQLKKNLKRVTATRSHGTSIETDAVRYSTYAILVCFAVFAVILTALGMIAGVTALFLLVIGA